MFTSNLYQGKKKKSYLWGKSKALTKPAWMGNTVQSIILIVFNIN